MSLFRRQRGDFGIVTVEVGAIAMIKFGIGAFQNDPGLLECEFESGRFTTEFRDAEDSLGARSLRNTLNRTEMAVRASCTASQEMNLISLLH